LIFLAVVGEAEAVEKEEEHALVVVKKPLKLKKPQNLLAY
jgi:hypothetical protein